MLWVALHLPALDLTLEHEGHRTVGPTTLSPSSRSRASKSLSVESPSFASPFTGSTQAMPFGFPWKRIWS